MITIEQTALPEWTEATIVDKVTTIKPAERRCVHWKGPLYWDVPERTERWFKLHCRYVRTEEFPGGKHETTTTFHEWRRVDDVVWNTYEIGREVQMKTRLHYPFIMKNEEIE